MKLSEFIAQAKQHFPDSDPELIVYDHSTGQELRVDADADRFDFEVMRGDNVVVLEVTT